MKYYMVYDYYEMDEEFLGRAANKEELAKIVKQRIMDTDGECDIIIEEVDVATA